VKYFLAGEFILRFFLFPVTYYLFSDRELGYKTNHRYKRDIADKNFSLILIINIFQSKV